MYKVVHLLNNIGKPLSLIRSVRCTCHSFSLSMFFSLSLSLSVSFLNRYSSLSRSDRLGVGVPVPDSSRDLPTSPWCVASAAGRCLCPDPSLSAPLCSSDVPLSLFSFGVPLCVFQFIYAVAVPTTTCVRLVGVPLSPCVLVRCPFLSLCVRSMSLSLSVFVRCPSLSVCNWSVSLSLSLSV